MNEFIKQNKPLLEIYCFLAKLFGGVLTFFGCMAVIGHSLALISRAGDISSFLDYFKDVPWGVIAFLPTGYLVLGLAQFIRYLFDDEYQPGWILRNAVQFVYFYAVVLAVILTIFCAIECSRYPNQWYEIAYRGLSFVFYGGGKVLLLVGLGQIIRRIIPVIEESKTLV
jgi:hypothetical protein